MSFVRMSLDDTYTFEDDEEQRMYQMPLVGENFKRDNKLVYNMLKAACIESDARGSRTMISQLTDGKPGMRSSHIMMVPANSTNVLNDPRKKSHVCTKRMR